MSKNQKNKNLLGLVAAGATLASSVFMFAVKPAQAASLTDNWSFSGLANTGSTFVAADDATSRLLIIAQTEMPEGEKEGEGDEGSETDNYGGPFDQEIEKPEG